VLRRKAPYSCVGHRFVYDSRMNNQNDKPRMLHGWRAIARYLCVECRTLKRSVNAGDYAGVIKATPSGKVFAVVEDLDAYLAGLPSPAQVDL